MKNYISIFLCLLLSLTMSSCVKVDLDGQNVPTLVNSENSFVYAINNANYYSEWVSTSLNLDTAEIDLSITVSDFSHGQIIYSVVDDSLNVIMTDTIKQNVVVVQNLKSMYPASKIDIELTKFSGTVSLTLAETN